jgi:purine-binding chemotaxis protein CheW
METVREPAAAILPFDIGDQLTARLAQLGQEHCVFARQEHLFAVSVSAAREVLIGEAITPVPQAPPVLVGVLNLRGEVLPIVRLDPLLDLPSQPPTSEDQILVLSYRGTDVGVIVDRVREVRPIDPKEITALPDSTAAHRLYRGAWPGPMGTVIVLDAAGLVSAAAELVSAGFRDGQRVGAVRPAPGVEAGVTRGA